MTRALAWEGLALAEVGGCSVLPAAALRKLSEARLAWTLRHATLRVPFWQRRFREAGVGSPGHAALAMLPLTRKEDLQRADPRELVARGSVALHVEHTSGSTGDPFQVVLDEHDLAYARAVWIRSYLHLGLRPHHRRVALRMPDPHRAPAPALPLPSRRMVEVSADLPVGEQIAHLRRLRPQVLQGSPCELARVARWLEERGQTIDGVVLVVAGGEPLHDDVRELVRERLGTAPRRVYGSSEAGFVAWECRQRSHHVNSDHVFCELVPGDRSGPWSRLVVTTLQRRAMPLVRYVTGDLVLPARGPCPCGSRWPVLGEVLPESGFLRSPDGGVLTERDIGRALATAGGSDGFRLFRDSTDRIVVRAERNLLAGAASRARVLAALRPLLGDRMKIDLEPVPDLGWTGLDKRCLVVGDTHPVPNPSRS